jgi:hypothetical protein
MSLYFTVHYNEHLGGRTVLPGSPEEPLGGGQVSQFEDRGLRESQETDGIPCSPKSWADLRRSFKKVQKTKERGYATIHHGKFLPGRRDLGRTWTDGLVLEI